MRIALDVMGGDHAPQSPLDGAIEAVRAMPEIEVVLVGPEALIREELAKRADAPAFDIVHASEVIGMDEHPAQAVRSKKDATMVVGMKLLKDGKADAFVSAGNTGGMLAAGIFNVGRIRGVKRPALGSRLPTRHPMFLLDLGANADVRPDYLQQFALMGSLYAERVLGVRNPRVGLLSNGEEEGKGNETVQEAFGLIQQLPINFGGNAEGRDIWNGRFNVIVTDGFTGNIVLKSAEGMGRMIRDMLKETFKSDPLSMLSGALFMPFGYKKIKKMMDPDEIGAAPLLGLNGAVLVAHGSSSPYAIHNAIRTASEVVKSNFIGMVEEALAATKENE
ncbi:MAG: phosphate acyltransferase PlsX [Anaerolineales bacterium]|nr:phosphate acyltransferase PlsX [Anaerolineales bacterium]MCB9127760.1 phosphate acyltransferase PlsX [Ardenticatenales bacterium]